MNLINQRFLEIAHENSAIYDGIHEYCSVEHVNEEHFRASVSERRRSILTKMFQVFSSTTKQEKDKLHDEGSKKAIMNAGR
ncbi:MAG TPA: hypothetical protein DIW17_09195 [Clostridiales bacterium]|nr:hypothetical protein [Clostridia bacterium]MDD4679558.1 hypothetical protein [Clostridia bacterium]HCS74037.1 hypothetical protein [Clostridiales bacterium]